MFSKWLKYPFYAAIMSLTMVNANCGSGDNELQISITPDRSFFLPGDVEFFDGDACYDATTITEPRFQIDEITTTFTGAGTFTPILLKISFNGNGNISEYTCAIAGKSSSGLGQFLFDDVNTLSTGETKTMSICNVVCGGVQILGSGSFSVSGTVELIGIRKDGDAQVPMTTSVSLSLTNIL